MSIILLLGMNACVKDLGNDRYKQINTVKIEDIGNVNGLNNYVKNIGDTLKVNPVLKFSEGEDENLFNYAWYYWGGGNWNLLQQSRNLTVEVSGPFGKATENAPYRLAYEIQNKETKVFYRKTFSLRVENPLTKGYAAICEMENGFDIDFITLSNNDNKFHFYKGILEMTGSTLPRNDAKPYDILAFDDPMAPDPFNKVGAEYSLFVLTDKYTTRLLAGDYSWKDSYDISNNMELNSHLDKEYTQKGKKIIAQKMKFSYFNMTNRHVRSFIYHKETDGTGNWYMCSSYPMWLLYSVQMNRFRSGDHQRYEPSQHIYAGARGAMYYDNSNKAFIYGTLPNVQSSANMYYSEPLSNTQPLFHDTDYESIVHIGEILGSNFHLKGFAILKLNDGSFRYIEFDDAVAIGDVGVSTQSNISATHNLDRAKYIAKTPNNPFVMYVTDDNRVFQLDISSIQAVGTEITNLFITTDGYNEITLFKHTLPNTNSLAAGLNNALAVGTYNTSLGKNTGGKLEFFKITNNALGTMELVKYPDVPREDGYQIPMTWTGLGKITGLTYKEK